jgi:outer membrane receptor protein involved in Fe transport
MNSVGTGQTTTGNGVYSELALPLVQKSNRVLGVQQLELQLAGRVDDYKSSVTNPVSQSTTINNLTGVVTYSPATTTGQPISPLNKTGSYRSWNDTVALKYTPVAGVTLRLSFAAGFAPPTMTQLRPPVSTGTSNQTSGAYPGVPTSAPWSYSTLTDPARGNAVYSVPFMSGGNPNLKPETTRNVDWGIILEPGFLRGLRLSVDYQKVTKYDAIVGPTAAQLLANPALFGSRIIRGPLNPGDTFSVGPITLLDATNLNATRFMTSMFNFSLDYTRRTAEWGVWALSGTGSMWQHNVTQAAIGAAQIENLSNPNPGSTTSPGLAKFKGTLSLDWNRGHWGAGWVMRYTGPYTVGSLYGIGGARPVQDTVDGWVSGQIYHDAHVRYRWDRAAGGSSRLARSLRNTTLTLGIKNIFDRLPPYDAAGSMLLYSRYGDVRLASYYVSVRKSL